MGCSQNLPSFIPALLFTAFSLAIFPSHAILHENLLTICSTTSDPSRCQKILSNDSRTTSADLPGLSLISINLTMKRADQNHEIQINVKKAYELSKKQIFRDNDPLLVSKKLVVECGQGIIINSLYIEVMNKLMILCCETSISVNQYAAANAHIQ